ncbi:MAG: PepSY domain-containing protein [Rhizobiales bacterium]|nr:PepSY domain-containing protein [Hyphomicrobiales bacterium]
MWRTIHSFIGLVAGVLLVLTALSGGFLATEVILKSTSPFVQNVNGLTTADGLKTLMSNYREVEKLTQKPNGSFLLTHRIQNKAYKIYVDLHTAERLDKERKSEFYAWMRGLHRSLFMERLGRAIVGFAALIMSILCISGTLLIIRRQGGIVAFFSKVRGHWSEKLHTIFGRLSLIPLIIIGITGLYMSLVTFHFLPSGSGPQFPETLKELPPVPAYKLQAFKQIPLGDIKEISFPIPGDWFDVYTVKTKTGYIFIDQFTGEIITKPSFSISQQIFDWVMFLHTAEGSYIWASVLVVVSLSVPIFMITGTVVWWRRSRAGVGRMKQNVAAHLAEMVILVGSESGSTWGFAKNLHQNLTNSGVKVHINQMNKVRQYPKAKHLYLFMATYGDGDAPQNANKFLRRIQHLLTASKYAKLQKWSYSILAFGDKAFPKYCAFAHEADALLMRLERNKKIETIEVNRKSSQTFAHWAKLMVEALKPDYAINGDFNYTPPRPKTKTLILRSRTDYGIAVNAPTTVFKFSNTRNKVGKHVAGDLVGIVPPNDNIARLYSIGSNSTDNKLEICVKKLEGGLCSTFLHNMKIGETIDMYLIKNEDFHIPKNNKPIALIGAGTGIAPFIGMIRNNSKKSPITLYWGGRDPKSDFLYESEIKEWLDDGRLTKFCPAFSRVKHKQYVQDVVEFNASQIATDLKMGGTVMVCGGSAMASAVRGVLEPWFNDNNINLDILKKKQLYLEDIY